MSRWEPDARGRLEQAAYELFRDRGYDQTTVADIAKRAGLTERTFFRHYADKREVLFGGAGALHDELLHALEGVLPELPPIEAVRIAVETISALMRGRLPLARERRRIIAAHPDLLERDLNKRSTLTGALEDGLKRRGVSESAASLAAEMGIAVFYSGFNRWLDDSKDRELIEIVHELFDELKAVAAGAASRNVDA
ncbi:MAG: TetR family transcriptional regulator [Candidatus Eremiobacteraeota bacterium]|nr:TetR family transcriptional regulator [Candidatus Eremiobacteraeota bacterium]